MSTQSYYKDRLGFDPREALYDNNNGDVSPPLKSPQQQQQQRHSGVGVGSGGHSGTKHFYNNGGSPSPGFNNGGSPDYYHRSPPKRHKHSSFSGASPVTGSPLNVTSQGGYEDALTQFKGTELMTIWEHFVWDTIGTSCGSHRNPVCLFHFSTSMFWSAVDIVLCLIRI